MLRAAVLSVLVCSGHAFVPPPQQRLQSLARTGAADAATAVCSSNTVAAHARRSRSSRRGVPAMSSTSVAAEVPTASAATSKEWVWRGHKIRYVAAGEDSDGPAMILVHGFGGNADHFRKNTPELGKTGPTYAIDLLGYGYSDKPDPGPWEEKNKIYNFENWGEQILDFAREVVRRPVFVVCNSVGGCAGLQAAKIGGPSTVRGVVLFNISLRMLHTTKQPALLRPLVSALQYALRETGLGPAFFDSVAQAKTVKNILQQCYGDPATVTDELVEAILKPGLQPGAVKVFLDFISYSGGPLPEELLPEMQVPVLIGWGAADPWEPLAMGRAYGEYPCVESFVTLPGVGHCPQDEAPHLVNPIIRDFVLKHSGGDGGSS